MEAMQAELRAVLDHKRGALHTVPSHLTVSAAVDLINTNNIGSVLVMDGDRLVGIFTERDVLRRVVGERRNPDSTRVADVMTRELVVMRPTATVQDAMTVVSEKRCRHIPVMEGDRLVGILSAGDLNHWVVRNRHLDVEHLISYITGAYPG